jgi:hypothetical protein
MALVVTVGVTGATGSTCRSHRGQSSPASASRPSRIHQPAHAAIGFGGCRAQPELRGGGRHATGAAPLQQSVLRRIGAATPKLAH